MTKEQWESPCKKCSHHNNEEHWCTLYDTPVNDNEPCGDFQAKET